MDAGCKVIGGERGLTSVKALSGLRIRALHAEHAPIEILVHYHDGTVNLHRHMYGMRSGRVDDVFTIEHF